MCTVLWRCKIPFIRHLLDAALTPWVNTWYLDTLCCNHSCKSFGVCLHQRCTSRDGNVCQVFLAKKMMLNHIGWRPSVNSNLSITYCITFSSRIALYLALSIVPPVPPCYLLKRSLPTVWCADMLCSRWWAVVCCRHTRHFALRPNSYILVSSDRSTFFHMFAVSLTWLVANWMSYGLLSILLSSIFLE